MKSVFEHSSGACYKKKYLYNFTSEIYLTDFCCKQLANFWEHSLSHCKIWTVKALNGRMSIGCYDSRLTKTLTFWYPEKKHGPLESEVLSATSRVCIFWQSVGSWQQQKEKPSWVTEKKERWKPEGSDCDLLSQTCNAVRPSQISCLQS